MYMLGKRYLSMKISCVRGIKPNSQDKSQINYKKNFLCTNSLKEDSVSFGAITENQEERLIAFAYKLFFDIQEINKNPQSPKLLKAIVNKTKNFIKKQKSILEKLDPKEGFQYEVYFFGGTEITPIICDKRVIINQSQRGTWLNSLHIDLANKEAVLMINRENDKPIFEIIELDI